MEEVEAARPLGVQNDMHGVGTDEGDGGGVDVGHDRLDQNLAAVVLVASDVRELDERLLLGAGRGSSREIFGDRGRSSAVVGRWCLLEALLKGDATDELRQAVDERRRVHGVREEARLGYEAISQHEREEHDDVDEGGDLVFLVQGKTVGSVLSFACRAY